MSEYLFGCQQQAQPLRSHGLIGDCDIEFGSDSFQFFDIIDNWNTSTIDGQPAVESGVPKQQHAGADKSSCTILSHFRSPASAFFATERCMGLPLYESQFSDSETNDLQQFPMYRSFRDSPCKEIAQLVDPNFETCNTLEAMVRPQLNNGSSQKSNTTTLGILSGSKFLPPAQLSFGESSNSIMGRHLSIPSGRNQDPIVVSSSYGSSIRPTDSSPKSPMFPSLGSSAASAATPASSKTRIRWTQVLHEKFVECVDRIGGSEKATPKAILKLMESDGLTIFHLKSHLQKYRTAKYKPESAEGKGDKRAILNDVNQVELKTGLQLKEALQLQLDFQRRLHEQLEIQRNLQLRIEEQGRQLKKMFDQQQKTGHSICETSNQDITPNC